MKDALLALLAQYQELEKKLSDPLVLADVSELKKISQEYKHISNKIPLVKELLSVYEGIDFAKETLKSETDTEILNWTKSELVELESKLLPLEQKVKIALLPDDPNDGKNVIVEIRAGAGGDESSLFGMELFRMYSRYALTRGWQVSILSENENDAGGYKEIAFEVSGERVYSELKFESGVHRVQRVPVTESQGRIHTSTVTVAVLPEVEEVDVVINESDLEIDTFRASGAGGQHVNKTDSAIRLTHRPSGIVVACQEDRSQHKNREKALSILRAKLYEVEQERLAKERGDERKNQIGTGDRSEKIRTYNFPQDRITDHRIGKNWSNIPLFMEGNIRDMIDTLLLFEEQQKLENL